MGTFSTDNFGNDGAQDYLAMQTAKLVATIKEVLADEERIQPDEDGETLLMPSVEILALLCERYGATPPRPTTVRQWADKYLAAYDHGAGRLKQSAEFRTERRKVIDKTFRWLSGLAESHWAS
jgi:hypothetical protein